MHTQRRFLRILRVDPFPSAYAGRGRRAFSTEVTYRKLQKSDTEVAHVTFNGRKKYAFLNNESLSRLTNLFAELERRENLGGVFLRSTFPGADIKEMAALTSFDAAIAFITRISDFCNQIYSASFPVVAVVDGPCLGAGMEIAASCDLRIAVEGAAVFGMPETILGIPSIAQASLIPGLIGWGRARELLYFGTTIDSIKAHDWGFVNTLTARDDLERTIQEYEDKIDATGIGAIQTQKRVMAHWQSYDAGVLGNSEYTNRQFARLIQTGRPAELMNQFMSNRPTKDTNNKRDE